jgi:hypothetical protein
MAQAFGSLKENLYQSDYIRRKIGKSVYCNAPSYCNQIKSANSYNTVNLFNLGRYSRNLQANHIIAINKTNLIMGQYTKSNLEGVCTAIPTPPCVSIDSCVPCAEKYPVPISNQDLNPFYWNNTIDPLGELFGNTQCGELNYTKYMVLYPPTNPI